MPPGFMKRSCTIRTERNKRLIAFAIAVFTTLLLPGCVTTLPSLGDWTSSGDAGWQLEGNKVSSTNPTGTGYLVSNKTFADFELEIDFLPDPAVNSGILIRCQDPADINPASCYEINIWDNHPNQDFRTGAIVLHAAPPLVHVNSAGKWNHYRIRAEGNRIRVWLDGELTAEIGDANPGGGYIALQSENGIVSFRALDIRR